MSRTTHLGKKVIRPAQAILVATTYEPVKEEEPDKPEGETASGVDYWLDQFKTRKEVKRVLVDTVS
jgi:hypothetical protein